MKRSKLFGIALGCLMAVNLIGCGASSSSSSTGSDAASGDTIKIGIFEPKTGENGGGGAQEELAIEYANYVRPTVTVGGKEYKIQLD